MSKDIYHTEKAKPQRRKTTFPKFTHRKKTAQFGWIVNTSELMLWVTEVEKRIEALEATSKEVIEK